MRQDFKAWLEAQKYSSNTITSQLHRVGRVEDAYGNLEEVFAHDQFAGLLAELRYSTDDLRRNRPNPSKIKFEGDPRKNLASYRSAVVRYGRFLSGGNDGPEDGFVRETTASASNLTSAFSTDVSEQKLSLERDMQAALRRNIRKLGQTLSIIDDGAERSVDSGLIDITCEDESDQAVVVIELKAGKADSRAIGQVLGYMGDLTVEDDTKAVRGILVAHEFDQRAISAARAVPTLQLVKYSVDFSFEMLG